MYFLNDNFLTTSETIIINFDTLIIIIPDNIVNSNRKTGSGNLSCFLFSCTGLLVDGFFPFVHHFVAVLA